MQMKVMTIGFVVVFIAVFVLFFIFHNISKIRGQCDINKNLKICKLNSLPIVILMLLLIAGGLIIVINITAYIMISGSTGVACAKTN